jgi:EAL domain-containing protein (putative c-di-GMP-specific phosphodiesterase class I)
LIRWQHPTRGFVPPMEFLPIVVSTELEIRIGNWVIDEAWRQLVIWHQQGLQLEVSVNISGYHLLWPGFYEHIQSVMQRNPSVASKYLQLEVLESSALDDLAAVCSMVKTCNEELGIGIALDDFGTGYSSLNHLRRLSVNLVKIDQSFVRDMLDDPDDFAIVESVIGLSSAFRREVLAEGVESKQLGSALLLLGCHLLQGYAIARPMPADNIYDWVLAYRPFLEWGFFSAADLTPEQKILAIRRIETEQWLERVQHCVFANAELSQLMWPILEPAKCLLGRWLRQAKVNKQYNRVWLEHVEQVFHDMLSLAMVLQQKQMAGQQAEARAGFPELQAQQQRVDELLAAFMYENS